MSSFVLIVDDDQMIANLISEVIKSLNLTPVTCSNGVDAMCRFMSMDAKNFSAAIIDLSMPQMNGADLVKRLRAGNPNIITILCSGFPDMLGPKFTEYGFNAVISKPFTINDFKSQFLRALMDA
jgi:CheY-like chemotaxis protein